MTEQYARGEEKPIAEFNELNDAKNFMAKKSSNDEDEGKKVIYRLYDDTNLLHQLNRDNIITANAKYADGNSDFYTMSAFACKVMFQLVNTTERQSIAKFDDKDDARLFVISKCGADGTIFDNDLFLKLTLFDILSTSKILCFNCSACSICFCLISLNFNCFNSSNFESRNCIRC